MRINTRKTVFLHDLLMIAVAWELAWLIRLNFSLMIPPYWEVNLKTLPLVVAVQGIIAWRFGLYRGLWRFASLLDLWNIIRATVLGTVTITLLLFIAIRLEGVPRSVLMLYPLFLIFLLGGPRLTYRLWKDHSFNLKTMAGGQRVLIIGAGRAGETVVREMLRDGGFIPVGLLDDREELNHSRIHGIAVLGGIDALPEIVNQYEVDLIFIAMPSATRAQMQRVIERCEQCHKPFRILPRLQDMASNASALSELREVCIDDLLGREKVELDWKIIHRGLAKKIVMITGGGGSIGSELCHQVARLAPAALVVFERSEHNLYTIQGALRSRYPRLNLHPMLGDVCDPMAVELAMKQFKPEVIFHAAAYKHVPILEFQPREAVRNNVLGTKILAEAAARHRCEKFILISTDKAVNPGGILGASKRLAELLCAALAQETSTRFITVRFGNVLGSAGSVVPLFHEQIKAGGPVTVTHQQVSRYFMTVTEACQLILQAGAMGKGGEIFVLDMGEPIKIAYLAEQMIKLSGKLPNKDIKIEFIGLRPGEKLNEELFHKDETLENTQHKKILLARQQRQDRGSIYQYLQGLQDACERYDEEELRSLLHRIVPELVRTEHPIAKVIPLRERK